MTDFERAITLTGKERSDGSIYLTSKDLPGFHFILAPGENPEAALLPALLEFIPKYYMARFNHAKPVLKQRPTGLFSRKSSFNMDLCFG